MKEYSHLITVVITFYNRHIYMRECLQSILEQTLKDWSCIIVDDGSTVFLEDYVADLIDDQKFKIIKHEYNKGQAAARNTGFRAANTKYVLSVDSDDILDINFLAITSKVLLEDDAIDCVMVDFQHFGYRDYIEHKPIPDLRSMISDNWLPASGVLMKRELWEKVGGFSETDELRAGMEDCDFWLSCYEIGFKAAYVAKPLYRYRGHAVSRVSHSGQYNSHLCRTFIYNKHKELFDKYKLKQAFLSDGFRIAANWSLAKKKRFRALYLTIKAFYLQQNKECISLFLYAVLPTFVIQQIICLKKELKKLSWLQKIFRKH